MERIAKDSGGISVNKKEGMENCRLQKYSWSAVSSFEGLCNFQVGRWVHKQHGPRTCGHDLSLPSSLRLCALQAMGVYLYGELMLGEDARQQQVARRCFELTKEQMDRSSAEVVAEMLL